MPVAMRQTARFLVIMVLLLPTRAEASAPIRRSLLAQVAYSEAVAVGKVTKIDPIPFTKGLTFWRPNCKLTVAISEVLRGNPGKIVTAQAYLDDRSPIQTGSQVVMFISALGKSGSVEVFEAAQGLHPLSALVSATGDKEADKLIEKVLRAAIADSKPPEPGKMPYYADLGPKATGHFFPLAQSGNTKARHFGIASFADMKKDDAIGKILIPALKDQEKGIREQAAHALVWHEYTESADAVADYVATLPQSHLRRDAFRFLTKADPKKYDYAGHLQQWVSQLNPPPHQIFAGTLKDLPKGFHVWIQLEIDSELKCTIKHTAFSIRKNELATFVKSLDKLDLPSVRRLPFFCEIVIGYDNGKEFIKVDVQ